MAEETKTPVWIQPLGYAVALAFAALFAKLDSSHTLLKALDSVTGFSDYIAAKVGGTRTYSRVVYFNQDSPNDPQQLYFEIKPNEQAVLHVYDPIFYNVKGPFINIDAASLAKGDQINEKNGTFDQLQKLIPHSFIREENEHILSVYPGLLVRKNQRTPNYFMSFEARITVAPQDHI